jgi:hypothetical protein
MNKNKREILWREQVDPRGGPFVKGTILDERFFGEVHLILISFCLSNTKEEEWFKESELEIYPLEEE